MSGDTSSFTNMINQKYKLISKKGEGTFSEVIKAQSLKTGDMVAIKRMKNQFDSLEQVNNLREIQALKRLSPHPHVIKLVEFIYDRSSCKLALVFELMEMNLYEMIRGRRQYLSEKKLKSYMYQLMIALDHMHQNGIFHRDIKPENILVKEDHLKLADFGSCRGIYSKQPYTEYISTRWYRAPECLLTDGYYSSKMDIWGMGCVFFEITSLYPLFPGSNELDQIQKIHAIMGTPPQELLAKFKRYSAHVNVTFPPVDGSGIDKLLPQASADGLDLMKKMLIYNPDDRVTTRQCLRHQFFKELREQDKKLHTTQNNGSAPSNGNEASPHGNIRGNRSSRKEDNFEKLPQIGKESSLPTIQHSYNATEQSTGHASHKDSARGDAENADWNQPSSSLASSSENRHEEFLPSLTKGGHAGVIHEEQEHSSGILPPINMNHNSNAPGNMNHGGNFSVPGGPTQGKGGSKVAGKKQKRKVKHERTPVSHHAASTDSDDT